MQGGPSYSGWHSWRNPKIQKPQSSQGPQVNLLKFSPVEDIIIIIHNRKRQCVCPGTVSISQDCLLCKYSQKESLEQNVIRTLIHKTSKNAKDPPEIVSQQCVHYSQLSDDKTSGDLVTVIQICIKTSLYAKGCLQSSIAIARIRAHQRILHLEKVVIHISLITFCYLWPMQKENENLHKKNLAKENKKTKAETTPD